MGASVYPAASGGRLVGKQNTAIQSLLTGTVLTSASGSVGSWVQFSASTPVEYLITQIAYQAPVAVNTNFRDLRFDIGYGANGAESVLAPVPDMEPRNVNTTFLLAGGRVLPVPVRLAAGSRLAVRGGFYDVSASDQFSFNVQVVVTPWSAVEGN